MTYALNFETLNSVVDCGSDASIDDMPTLFGGFTVECWFKAAPGGEVAPRIVDKGTVRLIISNSETEMRFLLNASSTSMNLIVPFVPDNNWHHIACTYDDNASIRLGSMYIDGVAQSPTTAEPMVGTYSTDAANNLRFGNQSGGGRTYLGNIGWIRFSKGIRYGASFTPIARDTPPEVDLFTIAQWNMDEGTGATIDNDVGLAANDGTITTATWVTDNDGLVDAAVGDCAPIFKITDGTSEVDFLGNVYGVEEWIPQIVQLKGGGVYQGSSISDGRHLVFSREDNVTETISLTVSARSSDDYADQRRNLRTLITKARNFWITDWQDTPVWLEVRASGESNIRYALVMNAMVEEDEPVFQTPFLQPSGNRLGRISLILEREGSWRSLPPGDFATASIKSRDEDEYSSTKKAYVTNYSNPQLALTHVFVEDSVGGFSANLIGGGFPVSLVTEGYDLTGSHVYFGIETTIALDMTNIILSLSGQFGVNPLYEYEWEFRFASWDLVEPIDSSNGLSVNGTHSVAWRWGTLTGGKPTPSVVAVNGVTGVWIRLRLSGATAASTFGTFTLDSEPYIATNPYIEFDEDEISGDQNSLVEVVAENLSGTPWTLVPFNTLRPESSIQTCYVDTGAGTIDLVGDLLFDVNHDIGIKIPNVPIPRGADLRSAVLSFRYVAGVAPGFWSIHCEDSPSGADFTTEANFSARTRTSASATWNFTELADYYDSLVFSRDASAPVDEVINRDDWVEGSSLVFLIDYSSTSGSTLTLDSDIAEVSLMLEYNVGESSNKIVIGSRSLSRGQNFAAYINLNDTYNPYGITVSLPNPAIYRDSTLIGGAVFRTSPIGLSPTGGFVDFDIQGSVTGAVEWTDIISISLSSIMSAEYNGIFSAFMLMDYQVDDSISDDQLIVYRLIADIGGQSEVAVTPSSSNAPHADDIVPTHYPVHLGTVDLRQDTSLPIGQITLRIQFSTSSDFVGEIGSFSNNIYTIVLMPVDEWSGEFFDQATQGQGGNTAFGDTIISGIRPTRNISVAPLSKANERIAEWGVSSVAAPQVIPNRAQRLWFLSISNAAATDLIDKPTVQVGGTLLPSGFVYRLSSGENATALPAPQANPGAMHGITLRKVERAANLRGDK